MTHRFWLSLAAGGSVALLLGAYTFQSFGYLPCQMCHWQRWPHMAAIVIGALTLILGLRAMAYLGAIAAATTAALGAFHAGVEQKWWDGPASCTGGGGLDGITGDNLLPSVIEGPKLIMCDEISWSLLGLSMPAWNAVFSIFLVFFWLRAARTA
jgi:disulfide bond formation protein DsbB